ncbi:uncharacterized protein LOC123015997 [Tribolium madens]|uniref:uncharacterized protein LOC123015997 n=1 Tax=Tribolium madens TaxID=41895 RepID=UPI001CF756B3|nr:uncharacterized protein LOC123015997 [Tribolium madens]
MIVNLTLTGMPFFLLLGVLFLISCLGFIINFADTMTNILKIRIFMTVITAIYMTILFCWTGQQLIDVSNNLFFSLIGAPWYYWNLKNIKILLILIINCTKNDNIVLAGICVDYKLLVVILRISVSYALVLFKLRKSSLV